jgi:hypothetical protein
MGKMIEVKLSRDRLTAFLDCTDKNTEYTLEELSDLLKENHVQFGINEDVLHSIVNDPGSVSYPVAVASGKPPVHGSDAYLRNELKERQEEQGEIFNFRVVMHIPSVSRGEHLASLVPATEGTNGIDVMGNSIPSRKGRPLRIKTGSNILTQDGQYFSTVDGQVSITNKSISVNPVFEVNGDLDLRTGNIDFTGNVTIKGNVPSGYEVKAGGDIHVHGLVESAILIAGGNIIIRGGVAGGMKGSILAEGNVVANYLNQSNVKAAHDIIIKTSILHSRITAGGNIDCQTGTIIGGIISAGRNIFVKELGNELFTKTELAVGWDPFLEKRERDILEQMNSAKANISKLIEIESKLADLVKLTGKVSREQQEMIIKQRATRKSIQHTLKELEADLDSLAGEKQERLDSSLFVLDKVYPNAKMFFGKYALMTNRIYKMARFSLDQSEISIHSLTEAEKVHH